MMLVDVDDAKAQLYIDGPDHNQWLTDLIEMISSAVSNWVGDIDRLYEDEDHKDVVPAVRMAVLVELAYQFRYREGASELKQGDWYQTGYTLNMSSTALLQGLRKPRMA